MQDTSNTTQRDLIRRVFLANGFTVKPGKDDLKEYVFKAGEALIAEAFAAEACESDAKVNLPALDAVLRQKGDGATQPVAVDPAVRVDILHGREGGVINKLVVFERLGDYVPHHGDLLYRAPTVPRDVLVKALDDMMYHCACEWSNSDPDKMVELGHDDIERIADSYASKVQTEPVNQQLLAALKAITYESGGRYFVGVHGDTDVTDEVGAAIADGEAAQPVVLQQTISVTDERAAFEAWLQEGIDGTDTVRPSDDKVEAYFATWLARAQQPASAQPVAVPDGLLSADDMKNLRRFAECCEDFESGGHDVPKAAMKRLELAGAVRSCGFGRHETTAFGDAMLSASQKPEGV